MHWPTFMVASSKFHSCFSEYLTPMSTLQPLCLGLPSQGKKRHLHLSQVPTFKQVVGLEQVNRIHAVAHHGLDEVGEVF